MKWLVIIIMIFISYGYFCDGQGRGKRRSEKDLEVSDSESSSSSSSSSRRRKKEKAERRNRGIIHETTKRIVQYAKDMQTYCYDDPRFSYAGSADADINLLIEQLGDLNISKTDISFLNKNIHLKNFKKTNLCVKYTGYEYIMKLHDTSDDLKQIIKDSVQNYIQSIMYNFQIIHVNDPIFLPFFESFIQNLYNIVYIFVNTDVLVEVFNEINYLALDLILECEVPISYFLEYTRNYQNNITNLMIENFTSRNLRMSADALLNIWTAFNIPEIEGSISCVKTQLSVLLAFFKKLLPNENFNEHFIQTLLKFETYVRKNQYETTTSDTYEEIWKILNKNFIFIIDEIYSRLKMRSEDSNPLETRMVKNIIEYLVHSLLECRVERKYLFNKKYSAVHHIKKKFLSDDKQQGENINFFEKYRPNTLGCFKTSIDNLFNQLIEMNNIGCSTEYYNFVVEMAGVSSKCVVNPDSETLLECIRNFEKVAVEALLHFDRCLFNINDNTNNMKFYVADIFTKFRNLYQSCGASSEMMEVRWRELNNP